MEATYKRTIGPARAWSALAPLRAMPAGRLAGAGAALLLWSCAQGNSGGGPGETHIPAALARNTEDSAAESYCAGNDADETTPDAPLPTLDSQGVSPCDAQDPGVGWSTVPLLAASARHGLRMRVRNGSTLDVCIEGSRLDGSNYELFIDTDGNASTGVQETPWRSLGADYKVVNDALYGPSVANRWSGSSGPAPQVAKRSENAIVVHLNKDLLPGLEPHFALAFRTLSGWSTRCGWLPGAANHAVRLAPPRVPSGRRAQRGLIIPVYSLVPGVKSDKPDRTLTQEQCMAVLANDFSVLKPIDARRADVDTGEAPGQTGTSESAGTGENGSEGSSEGEGDSNPDATPGDETETETEENGTDDSVNLLADISEGETSALPEEVIAGSDVWTRLAAGAEKLGARQAGRDYWVAVNGPGSGPFMQQADFDVAIPVWKPIRDAGGKIFGYVHTHVTHNGSALRPLCEVVADVARWKLGYPEIDGIWIDEFYPQHESASATEGGVQIDPSGGYYAQLSQAIRRIDANLLLLGNVGSPLESNRRRYGELVDVACTIENKLSIAALNNWKGLLAAPIIPTYGQLALIHGFDTENPCAPEGTCPDVTVEKTVQRVLDYGYSHIFITDAVYEAPKEPGAPVEPVPDPDAKKKPALWLDLPPFFEALVDEVARQLGKP